MLSTLFGQVWPVTIVLLGAMFAACSGQPMTSGASAIPRCEDIPPIETGAEQSREGLIYVPEELHPQAVRKWAEGQPGFAGMWLDIEHNKWVTLGFGRDAAARHAEVEQAFPGEGVIVIEFDWTIAELRDLEQQVLSQKVPIGGPGPAVGAGILVDRGVVAIFTAGLPEETVEAIEARFGGMRVCIDPAELRAVGLQPAAGET